MFTNLKQMAMFVKLADSGASVSLYRKFLNISKNDVKHHLVHLDFYRNQTRDISYEDIQSLDVRHSSPISVLRYNGDNEKNSSMRFIWDNTIKHVLSYNESAIRILNLFKLLDKTHFSSTKRYNAHTVPELYAMGDVAILKCLIKKFNIKNVVEFGCGQSTSAMCEEGCNVTSFTLDDMSKKSRINHTLHIRNLYDMGAIKEVLELLPKTSMLFIDTPHNYDFAKHYVENVLEHARDKFIVIHDCYNSDRPLIQGENYAVNNLAINKTHQLWCFTDCLDYCDREHRNEVELLIPGISTYIIGKGDWRTIASSEGLDGPTLPNIGMCSYILAPLEFSSDT